MKGNQDLTPEFKAALAAAYKADQALARLTFRNFPVGTIIVATLRTHPHDYTVTGIRFRNGTPQLIAKRIGSDTKPAKISLGTYGPRFTVISRPEVAPARRIIAAPSFDIFREFCREQGLKTAGPLAPIYLRDRQQIAGLDRYTDAEVLPGNLSTAQADALNYIEARGGLITFHPSRRPR